MIKDRNKEDGVECPYWLATDPQTAAALCHLHCVSPSFSCSTVSLPPPKAEGSEVRRVRIRNKHICNICEKLSLCAV